MKASVAELRVLDYPFFVVCGNTMSFVVAKLLTLSIVSNLSSDYCFNLKVLLMRFFMLALRSNYFYCLCFLCIRLYLGFILLY